MIQVVFLDPIVILVRNFLKGIKNERSIPLSQILQALQVEVKCMKVRQSQALLFSTVGPRLPRTQD